MMNVNYRHILAGVCIALFFVVFTAVASATIYVPDDYAKIQWAVDNASAGDTIIVRDGTYTENVDVNKRLTIKSESGSDSTIVQAANQNDHVFEVTADYVNISGFTVEGANQWSAGIYLGIVAHCNIFDNIASNNVHGISSFSFNSNIVNNIAKSNIFEGIQISSNGGNILSNNIVDSNGDYGILIWHSSNNTLTGNTALNNSVGGIELEVSSSNILTNNMAIANSGKGGGYGIRLIDSCNNRITNNNVSSNNLHGIVLVSSSNNTLTNNSVSNNNDGICLTGPWPSNSNLSSNNNILTNNTVSNNTYYGIGLYASSSNNILSKNNITSNKNRGIELYNSANYNKICLNNFIDNARNVYSLDLTNIWNSTSKTVYTYKSKTYTNYLGNYWDDYTDVDSDSDGIWDNLYPIDSDKDYHPLVVPFENYIPPPSPKKILDVPFFSQRDLAWKNKKLDHSSYSIGGYGCALTSVSMLSNYFGFDTDPDRLNTSLTEVGGLDIHGVLHWEKVEKVTGGKVKWIGWSGGSWEKIDQELSKRNPVIANVSYPTTGYPYHFIVFIGKIDEKYYFLDTYDEQKELRKWPNGKLGKYTLKNLRIYHGTSSITITAYSPVDIVVTNPDDLTVSKQTNEIPGASYTEEDVNGDGDSDDIIFIPYRKTGEYMISLIPEADAAPDDKYTLVVSTETANTTLAENVSVSEIPTEPYGFESRFYFDTGSPPNPYPSIFGTHNGTIIPNQTITVSKLYTYPCLGTGGHTEYARIWNSTLDVNATWSGYNGDWHNISFNKSFTLVTNETYNYTIQTGSYPQIHHKTELPTANGWINCTKVIDANGKSYNDWIPAIMVW